MKSKKSPKQKLKEKAWDLCSLYIRLKYADENGEGHCYTCFKPFHYKALQAGHFVHSGGALALKFEERGLRPQCYYCNIGQSGNLINYMIHLEKELGVKAARKLRDELMMLKNVTRKISIGEYEDMIEDYKKRIKALQCSGS